MSDDDSPKHKNDHQVELYTLIYFIGPLDLVLRASRVLYYTINGGMYENRMMVLACFRTHFKLVLSNRQPRGGGLSDTSHVRRNAQSNIGTSSPALGH